MDLPSAFNAMHGTEFEYNNYGCASLTEFCMLLPNIFGMERGTKTGWLLYPGGKKKTEPSKLRLRIKQEQILLIIALNLCIHF